MQSPIPTAPPWAFEGHRRRVPRHPASAGVREDAGVVTALPWNSLPPADTKVVMGEPTDAELWQRAANGRSEAFGTLFERHARLVYNFCFRRTADWEQAEELTSVVFLEAWRRRNEVRLEGWSAAPWLLGVATNVLRNARRSQRRHRAALERLPREHEPDFSSAVDDRLDDERQMAAVLRVVGKLPRADQEILALCAWEGLSYEEAALALGTPVGTVRSRLSRARARLRELVGDSGHELSEPCISIQESPTT